MELLAPSDPRVVGPYRPRAVLGEGGMGRVYLATGPSGERVAVKLVRDTYSAHDSGFRGRLRREADAARRVRSPRTAQVVAADTEASIPWLAYEFHHGPALSQALKATGPLPEDAVLYLARGLAEALRDIHAGEFVHRDLSTGNILLGPDGPVVIDFGIARNAATGGDAGEITTVTRPGTLVGAPGFMSPEQAMGLALTPVSDVFSLGTILLTAATGRNPFRDTSPSETRRRVIEQEPQIPLRDERLRSVVEACLVKDPAVRPTAARLLDMLAGVPVPPIPPWPEAVRRIATEQQEQVYWLTHGDPNTPLPGPRELDPAAVFGQPASRPPATGATSAVIDSVPPAGPAFETAPSPATDTATDLDADRPEGRVDIVTTGGDDGRRRRRVGLWVGAGAAVALAVVVALGLTVFRDLLPVPPAATPVAAPSSTGASGTGTPGTPAASPGEAVSGNPMADQPAFFAQAGECVDGDPEDGAIWNIVRCGAGSFEVAERIEGADAADGCPDDPAHHYERYFGPAGDPAEDVRLCLTMNYPGDAWRASEGDCIHRPGGVDSIEFEIVDCDDETANGRVAALVEEYEAPEQCDPWGSLYTTWRPFGFDDLGYTMCYDEL
ncbi:serine/threonine protein kinase [Myceligenerans pegani]|uniref:Serine/threonine protein kinase n=1 Tax=Myceligenerans pegani TaxID=2776917 RepID=A0ABR9MWW6_9MICO|nr:serine/threonine-protein kinase [Myceligenerans sp. TRM 65318]MBE1875867.1 serine/threonine protein kinase [Myceligenerans sp. TRM 65318]MBE3018138.1 serine/threonine protein kinase [Myceligenerans sp. TRM 65318]